MNTQALLNTLARARSAIGHGITYHLGEGGVDPKAALPTDDGRCDCSGFVAWCLQISRVPKPSRDWWVQTDNIWHDAMGPQTTFVRIEKPIAGCVVVYPKIGSHDGYGHTGIVANPANPYTVVDCSASKNGIFEHVQNAFEANPHTIFCILKQDA